MQKIELVGPAKCSGCEACVSICPTHSILMKEDKEGFLQPSINTKTCIKCHKCERTCPIVNLGNKEESYETKAYAAINLDEVIRRRSSSGGVFYALAEWIIKQGGVVFGARFNADWEVVHDFAETMDGIIPFMGSKYVQSRIGDTYLQAKKFLEDGRWVLFSGTPCQLGGLRSFLGKEYNHLLQVDIICYGVPSPGVWRSYLQEHKRKKGEIRHISFRDKRDGWRNCRFIISFDKGAEEIDGPFMKGFSYKVYLRKSCYECSFRHYHRDSDLTIADYWGVHKFCQDMYDDKGTSIVFSHSSIGDSVMTAISDIVRIIPQSRKNATEYNPFMETNHTMTHKRDRFFRIFRLTSSFEKSSFVIVKENFGTRVVRRIKRYLNRARRVFRK